MSVIKEKLTKYATGETAVKMMLINFCNAGRRC